MAKKKQSDKPRVHQELEGFGVTVNPLGEVRIDYDLDKLNQFLNRTVRDKKFRGRTDIEGVPEEMTRPLAGEGPHEDPPPPPHSHLDDDPELLTLDEMAHHQGIDIDDAELADELGPKLKALPPDIEDIDTDLPDDPSDEPPSLGR